jgi:hypothetical protein
VATALNRKQQVLLAREVDRVDDVRRPGALHDQRGPTIDEPVPDHASIVIALIARALDTSAHGFHEALDRL